MIRISILVCSLWILAALLQTASSFEARISGDPLTSGVITLTFDTEQNISYQVYTSEDGSFWQPLGDPIPGTGSTLDIVRSAPNSAQFYKVAKAACWNAFSWDSAAWQ